MDKHAIEMELNKIASEPGGMNKIAAIMAEPIKEDVLYENKTMQLFRNVMLEPGEEAVFDGDIRTPGFALSVEGLPYQVEVKAGRVRIDTAPISVKAQIMWNQLNYRKFDILDWTQARMKSSLLEAIDTKGFNVIEAASETYNTKVLSPGKLYLDKIAEASAKIKASLRTDAVKLVIPAIRESDLLIPQYSNGGTIMNQPFAAEFNTEILRKGIYGHLFTMDVLSVPKRQDGTDIIDPNTAYVLGPSDLIGIVATRTEITARAQTSVRQESELFSLYSDLGFYIKYAKGIVKIDLSDIES